MDTVRLFAFLLSGTAAVFIGSLVLDGSLSVDTTKQTIMGLWLWLGWAAPAVVLLIDKVRS